MYTAKFLPEIELRKTKLQNAMKNAEADAMLISSNTNLFYTSGRIFCGYTYIPVEGEILFFVRRPVDLKGDNVIYIRKPEDIPAIMHERGINMPQKLLLEDDVLTYNERIRLATIFTNATFDNSSQIIRNVRAIKTPYEIELIRESAAKHASMYHRIPAEYKDGMSDTEFSIELERLARLHGSLGIVRIFGSSMEIYMGSLLSGDNADTPSPYDFALGGAGLNSSLPIGCNGAMIRPGTTVMVDIGGNFTGYMSDLSRVFSLGEIPELAQNAHQVALQIQDAIIEKGRPGVPVAELYELALNTAKQAGLEEYFMGHRQHAGFIGHGVGIELNEKPVLAPRSKEILEENMVFALEPKFVIPHVGAVVIENTLLVTKTGIEKITHCPEEIIPLD